ncbi:MAG: ABC transporter ATP-binding protein [Clostridia bacterium]
MTKEKFGIKKYLKKYWYAITLYIIFSLIASGGAIMYTLGFAEMIEEITAGAFGLAIKIGFFITSVLVIERGCWYVVNYIYYKYSGIIMAGMNLELASQIFNLDSKTFKNHDTGTFVQRIVQDPERVVEKLSGIVDAITNIITNGIMMIYICTLNIYIGLCLIALMLVCFAFEKIRTKVRRKNRGQMRKDYDAINSLTQEIVRSEKDIKSLGLEDKLTEVSRSSYEKYKKSNYKFNRVDYTLWSTRSMLIRVCTTLILVFGIVLMEKALLTLSAFMIIYSGRGALHDIVWYFGHIFDCLVDIKVSTGRMYSLFDEKEFTTEKFGKVKLDKVVGRIEFKNVDFTYRDYEYSYDDKKDKKDKKDNKAQNKLHRKLVSKTKIFENLSFKIKANQTVAFVGKSGSGKSTILNIMSKMDLVDKGEVLIDGININTLDKTSLRGAISLVNQFPYIFDMTIRDNLQLAKQDATDDEIWNALKQASLYDFVKGLKNGLDSKVGESGIKLSGGQKQRLAIARAMLRNSPIIIFDESTSSLDNFAQEDIKKSIDNLKGKSTIVIVAHRLSTIRNVDKIFFLDGGKIVDSGTFDELYENNELFKSMFLMEEKN